MTCPTCNGTHRTVEAEGPFGFEEEVWCPDCGPVPEEPSVKDAPLLTPIQQAL